MFSTSFPASTVSFPFLSPVRSARMVESVFCCTPNTYKHETNKTKKITMWQNTLFCSSPGKQKGMEWKAEDAIELKHWQGQGHSM